MTHPRFLLFFLFVFPVYALNALNARVVQDQYGNLHVNASTGMAVFVDGVNIKALEADLSSTKAAFSTMQTTIASLQSQLSAIKVGKV